MFARLWAEEQELQRLEKSKGFLKREELQDPETFRRYMAYRQHISLGPYEDQFNQEQLEEALREEAEELARKQDQQGL